MNLTTTNQTTNGGLLNRIVGLWLKYILRCIVFAPGVCVSLIFVGGFWLADVEDEQMKHNWQLIKRLYTPPCKSNGESIDGATYQKGTNAK